MAIKCAITGKPIQTTFLNKIVGTVIKDSKGKKHYISPQAQQQFGNDKSTLLQHIQ